MIDSVYARFEEQIYQLARFEEQIYQLAWFEERSIMHGLKYENGDLKV